jgi:hypothetical protein
MSWKAVTLVAVAAAVAAGCSNPPAAESMPAQKPRAQQASTWRAPIVATTSNREVLSYLASPSGSFQIIDECLAFISISGIRYTPVFGRGSGSPVPGPDGILWGGRTFRYGEKLVMGGGSAPRDLEINEEARRNCPGPYQVISGVSPRSKQELDEILSRRKPPPPKPD